jgi:single-strand DNA-binding protein
VSQDLNLQVFSGNLGKDPEIRQTKSGETQATFSLGVSSWRKDESTGKNVTDWFRIKTYGKTAEVVGQYCQKGTRVQVVTRAETGSYEKDGQTVYFTDYIANQVLFLGNTKGSENGGNGNGNNGNSSRGSYSGGDEEVGAPAPPQRPIVKKKSGGNPF